MDIISEHIENMTLDQLKHNARAALVAEACRKADPEEISDDREFLMDRALNGVKIGAVRITWPAYERAVELGDKPNDVAAANWHRRLLNVVPLLDEWEEQDPSTFIGYLGDHHTLPKPPPVVCDNYAARMPWVQTNLLRGPLVTETPEFRRLCDEGDDAAISAHAARVLGDLAVFTAHLPDELFIP